MTVKVLLKLDDETARRWYTKLSRAFPGLKGEEGKTVGLSALIVPAIEKFIAPKSKKLPAKPKDDDSAS